MHGLRDVRDRMPGLCDRSLQIRYESLNGQKDAVASGTITINQQVIGFSMSIQSGLKIKSIIIDGVSKEFEINCLANKNPELSKEWDFEENYPLTPHDVLCRGKKVYGWKCLICGYKWEKRAGYARADITDGLVYKRRYFHITPRFSSDNRLCGIRYLRIY